MPSQFNYAGNAIAYAVVVESLMDEAYTIEELIKLSGLADSTTWKFVRALHRRKRAYVAVWRTDRWGRHTKPAYKLGMLPDAVRPPPKSSTRRSLERRQRDALERMKEQV